MDLARSLKAHNIRIVPNTAGKDTVGIEVPNIKKERVRLKELMSAEGDKVKKMRLPMFLGKDASGNPLIQDLAAMPHMLIAGTTGSGKSVCMNSIIMSFLYTKRPDELKLVLVDPKMVEMSMFKDIPHLMCPVVTEMGKAAAILEWAVTKMDERYELLAEAGCRDITAYNGLGWEELRDRFNPRTELEEAKIPRKLPYLVFVIDELADLMMTNKEVESSIVRIAQKARAVGIHLILATQRPQANVVTGLIKSNMPGRVSFKVASAMDSRIVLDQKGGELLLGQGDMLMLTPRSSATIRAQGTLVDDAEIRRVVRFVRDNAGQNFEGQLVEIGNHGYEAKLHEDRMRESAQEDRLFDRAVELVLESGRGSVSMLQRRLAIGYTRSARLIEMMGEAGIIGGHKGTVAREVNMTMEEWEQIKAMAESPADDDPQASLFESPAARTAPRSDEVSAAERSALLGSGFQAVAEEDGAGVELVDTAPTATDRYANTAIDEEEPRVEAVVAEAERAPDEREHPEAEPEDDDQATAEAREDEEDPEAAEAECDDEEEDAVDESEDDGEAVAAEDEADAEDGWEEEEDGDAEDPEDDTEEYEYEYEYVDEDGNPIDPEDLEDGAYDEVDDEVEPEDADDEEPTDETPGVTTRPIGRGTRESAA